MEDSVILEVKNLEVSFGSEKVIDGLNFSLKEGENLVVVGPNGAGKTVLLKTLLGIIPHKGEINWKKGIRIGYVPQKFEADKNLPMSVEDFFKFKTSSREEMANVLNSVGIPDASILKKKIGVVSSGQLQRVLIAWGLLGNPSVLLFDEPTSGIDVRGEETIYKLLTDLDKKLKITTIFITHDLSVVYKFADSVLCLNKKPICFGPPEQAINHESLKELYGGEIKLHAHHNE
jgi:zinc transport system ATP-binding protein